MAHGIPEFMQIYEDLGHMERVPDAELDNSRAWYLPHHAIIQAAHTQPKIRVVFDASRPTVHQGSLNKYLMSGPPLQRDLALILTDWRRNKFAFTADIVKMFRQILIDHPDRPRQRILWRPTTAGPPVEYRLKMVTYGTACAPFLAIRNLIQLVADEGVKYPLGATCLLENTFVDDIFAGADSLDRAEIIILQPINLLRAGGFELDKWAAMHTSFIPKHHSSAQPYEATKLIEQDEFVHTLGLLWNPGADCFALNARNLEIKVEPPTKKSVLSSISRTFDPLGWIIPVTVTTKILMQDIWIFGCSMTADAGGFLYSWQSPRCAQ